MRIESESDSPYLTRKVASWACTLSSGFTSEATAAAALEKTSLSSCERRRDSINRNNQIRRNHMSQRIKVCIDRILLKDLMRLQPTVRTREGGQPAIALLARHGSTDRLCKCAL